MKDLITILVCNAIRAAQHETNVKARPLKDEEVLAIAVKVQCDYHKTELMRFINAHGGALSKSDGFSKGSVTPPEDMTKAAKETLGDLFDEFIEIHGTDFTPLQLVTFAGERAA